jgi:nitrite reductase/ring-hydroxylating ferredoxin subunit
MAASRGGSSSSLQWIRRVQTRLVDHLQRKTTDLGASLTNVQSSRAGDLYFRSQRDHVARAAPTFILPSCLLPAGHLVTDSLPNFEKTPIFVYREPKSGKVHAYVNQCRHRGAELVSSMSTTSMAMTHPRRWNGSAVTCPYHAWTYDIRNGSLKKVPGEDPGFPCLEKESLGLLSLPCQETAGGIWVDGSTVSGHSSSSPSSSSSEWWSLNEIDRELQDLWLDPPLPSSFNQKESPLSQLVGFREWQLKANWQLLVETFLEAYHVQFLHQNTLGRVTHGNRMVVEPLDTRSLRHTVPLSNFDISSSSDVDQDVSPTDPFFNQTSTTYLLFPSVSVSLFKRFAAFMSIVPEPANMDESNNGNSGSRVRLWAVTHATAQGEDLERQQRAECHPRAGGRLEMFRRHSTGIDKGYNGSSWKV